MRQIATLIALAGLLPQVGCSPEALPEAQPEALLKFFDATEDAGLADFRHRNGSAGQYWFPETMGAGGGFVDVDADGNLDVVLVAGGAWTGESDDAIHIFRNEGDGRFSRFQQAEPKGLSAYGFGIVAGDVDNDGDDDLFYTSLDRDALLVNDGGRYRDATASAGLTAPGGWSTAAAFFDADNDGWLDLYVARYVDWTPQKDIYCSQDGENKGYCTPELYQGSAGHFYRNRGDGTFEDRTQVAGFAGAHGKTLGTLVMDHNRDGLPDLMMANDTEPDELYLNQGDGTFNEIGVISGIAFDERGRARAGMGVEAGVVDQTGQETIFVGNFSSEMIGVYRHLGNDVFLDRAAASRIGQPSLLTLTFGMALADFDLDGDLDLFTANGHVQPHIEKVKENIRFREVPHLFRNKGDGTFSDVGAEAGLGVGGGWLGRSVSWGDYDSDGDPDLLLTENGGQLHLLRNDSETNSWIVVGLRGTTSNRNGIGARITVWADGQSQTRFVRSGASYLGQSQLSPIFGLGEAAAADSVVVNWPSGMVSRAAELASGSRWLAVEGS
ncbi:MAG: hypothetical protein ACI80V_002222 [Rhodothermales bacterium]|jgi:hypothetical protein